MIFVFDSGGKQRSKVEVQLNSQHHDASGDTRKIVQAMANNEKNQKHEKKWMIENFLFFSYGTIHDHLLSYILWDSI